MATPVWPLLLPQRPERDSFSEDYPDLRLKYDMDFGSKSRISGHLKPVELNVTYALTDEEFLILKDFVEKSTASGVKAFDYPDPFADGQLVRAAFLGDGSNIIKRTYFKNTNLWQVQLKLELFRYAPIS